MKDARGYTLVEILTAVAISLVLLGAIYAAVNSVQRSSAGIERKVTAQQDVRPALELMAMEIRMASYDPNFVTGIWRDAGACADAAASQTYRGIQAATASSITIEMDINGNRTIRNPTADNPNEIISYAYDTTNQYITRATNCGPALPFLGDRADGGRPRTVRVVNDTARPVFRYYDGSGNEITALPAGIPDIRTIEITLVAETADVDPNTGNPGTMIYSTTVIPRNHAPRQ